MKTTVEISDVILTQTKEAAREFNITLREIIESALRSYLEERKKRPQSFTLKKQSCSGQGVCEGIQEGKWEDIRSKIYEGRGG